MPSKVEIQRKLDKNELQVNDQVLGKSDVWKLFGKLSDSDGDVKGFVACRACKKVYVHQPTDGTQTLRKHQCEKGQSGPLARLPHTKQHTSFDWSSAGFCKTKETPVPKANKVDLNRTAVLACALDYRPLTFVKCQGFQLLAQSLIDIGAKYPKANAKTLFNCHDTYSRRVLPKLAGEARLAIKTSLSAQFKSMPNCLSPAAFTGDHWTDKYRQVEYTSIAVTIVDPDFNLKVYDLCVKEYEADSKHAHCIRADLLTKLQDFDVSESDMKRDGKFVFVSDSDAKLVAALREDFDRQSCVAHDLSLAVKHAMTKTDSSTIGLMIEGCKTLVRYFKKSGLNRQLSKSLKQEISTRFNSVYIMLSSVNDALDEVTVILTQNDSLSHLSHIKRKLLQSVCKELKRFDEATRKLAVEKEESIHLVIPVLHELHSKLCKEAEKFRGTGESDMYSLCKELATGVKDKCLSKLTWYHCAASVLFPPFLNHPAILSRESEKVRVRADLQVIIASFRTSQDHSAPRPKKRKKLLMDSSDSESSDSDNHDEAGSGAGRVDVDSSGTEVDVYFNSSFDCDDLRPLQFWKKQASAKKLPKLSVVARSIFAIPATQNRSERAFSAAGHIMTDLRTNLDPEHLNELLLLRSYHKLQLQDSLDTSSQGSEDSD